jgi:hypothetical protein
MPKFFDDKEKGAAFREQINFMLNMRVSTTESSADGKEESKDEPEKL